MGFSSGRGGELRQNPSFSRLINLFLFPLGLSRPGCGDFRRGKEKKKSRFLLRLKSRHVLREKYSGFSKAPKSRNGGGVRHCFQGCRFASFVRGWAGRAGSWQASPTQAGGRRRSSTLFFRGHVSAEPRKLEPVLKIMTSYAFADCTREARGAARHFSGQVRGRLCPTRARERGAEPREGGGGRARQSHPRGRGARDPPPLLPAGGRGARPRGAESG